MSVARATVAFVLRIVAVLCGSAGGYAYASQSNVTWRELRLSAACSRNMLENRL